MAIKVSGFGTLDSNATQPSLFWTVDDLQQTQLSMVIAGSLMNNRAGVQLGHLSLPQSMMCLGHLPCFMGQMLWFDGIISFVHVRVEFYISLAYPPLRAYVQTKARRH